MPFAGRETARRKRAAAGAVALWVAAALGLGAVRTAAGSEVWSLSLAPARDASLPEGPEAEPRAAARDSGSVARRAKRRKAGDKEKERPARRRRARVARRQRLALAVGHSLPVPVDKAPRYKLDNRHHDYPALDLTLRHGTPVRAITSGRVRKVTRFGACGRGVIVRGKDGLTYTYCHGNKVLVHKGERVPVGRTIMKSGNTGNSSGPHLHLQVASKRGRLLCPQHLLSKWQRGKKLPGWKVGRRRCVR